MSSFFIIANIRFPNAKIVIPSETAKENGRFFSRSCRFPVSLGRGHYHHSSKEIGIIGIILFLAAANYSYYSNSFQYDFPHIPDGDSPYYKRGADLLCRLSA